MCVEDVCFMKMSKLHKLTALLKQRLTAAGEETSVLFERTISEYEEELGSQQSNERRKQLLDEVLHPKADVLLPPVIKEALAPQQLERSPNLDQDQDSPLIKEEQEELRINQKGEQLRGLEETGFTELPYITVIVKTEEDEEKPQSSQLHQRQTQQNREKTVQEGSGGSEAHNNFNPDRYLEPISDDLSENSSEAEDGDVDYTLSHQVTNTTSNMNKNNVSVSDVGGEKKRHHCPGCDKTFKKMEHLRTHIRIHTGEKPFPCTVCDRRFTDKTTLVRHMRRHTGEKPFSCSVCDTRFARRSTLVDHMRHHTGEKPFICSVCDTRFTNKSALLRHMTCHSVEKAFRCSVCDTGFTNKPTLDRHMRCHSEEKPFSCSICKRSFRRKSHVYRHMKVHKTENTQMI